MAAWQTPSLVGRGALRDGVSPLAVCAKKVPSGKKLARCQKKLFQLNLKHPSNQTYNVSFPLHLFNLSSPFGLQHCSNRKSCFEIKKIKKANFVLKKMLKQDVSTSSKLSPSLVLAEALHFYLSWICTLLVPHKRAHFLVNSILFTRGSSAPEPSFCKQKFSKQCNWLVWIKVKVLFPKEP